MNTDTGQIYREEEMIQALIRGEPLVPVSESLADFSATQSVVWRQKVALALAELKRTHPDASEEWQEQRAKEIAWGR